MAAFNGAYTQYHQIASAITPHTTWRYGVRFFNERDGAYGRAREAIIDEDVVLELLPDEVISITMPTFKDTVSTRNSMNSRRSYNTGRDYTGQITIKFNMHPMYNPLYDVFRMSEFNVDAGSTFVQRVYLDSFRRFNAIEISLLSSEASMATQKQIVLQNVHSVDLNYDGLDYESDSKLTATLTAKYDMWYWSTIDHIAH